WSTSGFGGFWFDTPAYDGTNLYVGSVNGAFSGVDATTGTVLWQTFSSGVIFSSVGLANGYVFGTSTDGGFYILDAATGAIVDAHFLSGAGSASAVAIGMGYVWMDDASGTVYAYGAPGAGVMAAIEAQPRSEEHTSELQSRFDLVCRLLLEKKKKKNKIKLA